MKMVLGDCYIYCFKYKEFIVELNISVLIMFSDLELIKERKTL